VRGVHGDGRLGNERQAKSPPAAAFGSPRVEPMASTSTTASRAGDHGTAKVNCAQSHNHPDLLNHAKSPIETPTIRTIA
jgi:hypothetical protein